MGAVILAAVDIDNNMHNQVVLPAAEEAGNIHKEQADQAVVDYFAVDGYRTVQVVALSVLFQGTCRGNIPWNGTIFRIHNLNVEL